jgi:hypothetical protein
VPNGYRRLVLRGETWAWRYGKTVQIIAPSGARHRVELTVLKDCTWDDIERGKWKRYHSVEPAEIVGYINRSILGYQDASGFPAGVVPAGYQMPPIPEAIAVTLPSRGIWQCKAGEWLVDIFSPEGVKSTHRIYDLLGLTVDQWMDLKVEALAAAGETVDSIRLKTPLTEDRLRAVFEFPAPNIPKPSAQQVGDFVARTFGLN